MGLPIRMLVGLGNPTSKYEKTRHNAGFWFLDALAAHFGAAFHQDTRFLGWIARIEIDGVSIHLLKPATYMNQSGRAVSLLSRFYRIDPSEILVVHDELDLPPGTIRLKRGGGHGGHNGLRDIVAQLGTNNFYRLRLGIGHPGDRSRVVGYVLEPPSIEDGRALAAAAGRVLPLISDIMAGREEKVMQELHTEVRELAKSH